jgi:hypothetical protein
MGLKEVIDLIMKKNQNLVFENNKRQKNEAKN